VHYLKEISNVNSLKLYLINVLSKIKLKCYSCPSSIERKKIHLCKYVYHSKSECISILVKLLIQKIISSFQIIHLFNCIKKQNLFREF